MLTAPTPPTAQYEHASLYEFFELAKPFFSTKSSFSDLRLVYYKIWGVIQQGIYQSQLYNINELKCAYGVAQCH